MSSDRWRRTAWLVVVVFALHLAPGLLVPPARAALSGQEALYTAVGALACGVLASLAGPLGVVAGGLLGGLLGAMLVGVGVERLFLSGDGVANKERIVYAVAAVGFVLGAPLLGMLAMQAPLLGIASAAVLGGAAGMQLGQRSSAGEAPKPVAVPGLPLAPAASSGDALAALKARVDATRRALQETLTQGDLAAQRTAHQAYQEAARSFGRAAAGLTGTSTTRAP